MNLLKAHKTEIVIFLVTFFAGLTVFALALYLDRNVGDLDGDVAFSFPMYGQDAPRYLALAEYLVAAGTFTTDGITPEVFRTPGYPAILALSLVLTGNILLASIINIFFLASTAVLLYLLASKFLPHRWSVAASLLFALSPSALFHAVGSYGEIPFLFFMLLALYLTFFKAGRGMWVYGMAGICLALAALIRPIALYLPILLAPFLFYDFVYKQRIDRKPALLLGLSFCIGFALVVGPWLVRNSIVAGAFSLSSIGTYNLAHYNVPLFLESRFGSGSTEATTYRQSLTDIPHEQGKTFAESSILNARALEELKGNEVEYAIFHAVETSKFFLSSNVRYVVLHIQLPDVQRFFGLTDTAPNLLDQVRRADITGIISALRSQVLITFDRVLMLGLTILSVVSLLWKPRFGAILFLYLIFCFAILTGPVSIPRYRLPVEPLMVILSLYTIYAGYHWTITRFMARS